MTPIPEFDLEESPDPLIQLRRGPNDTGYTNPNDSLIVGEDVADAEAEEDAK